MVKLHHIKNGRFLQKNDRFRALGGSNDLNFDFCRFVFVEFFPTT